MKQRQTGLCRLCEQHRELHESHILPRFAMKWLKATAVAPIRSNEQPNRVVQDALKAYFLCTDCEQRFQKWETPFASKVFAPLHGEIEHIPARIEYNSWALSFALSVSWRVLRYHFEDPRFGELPAAARTRVGTALEVWQRFLRGEAPHPAEFEQHLVPFGPVEQPIPGMSPFFDRYIERSLDEDIADNGSETLVYVKLGRLLLFGVIPRGPRPKEWKRATRLAVNRGAIATKGWIQLPNGIAELLSSKAQAAARVMSSLSEHQKTLAAERFNANIQSRPDARLFEAYVRDYELFGNAALKIGDDPPEERDA
jgi:hypothetical protein